MTAPYSPLAIANEFIGRFASDDGIEHMKLQKLVYCSYGWWLAANGLDEERLTDEGPEVWKHGPVFDSLYRVLKVYGRAPIFDPQADGPFTEAPVTDVSDTQTARLVSWVWGRYGHLSSFALSNLTHKPGSPWHRVAIENDFRVPFNTRIPDYYIYQEFSELMLTTSNASEAVKSESDRRQFA